MFGSSPRPFTISPVSVRIDSLVRFAASEWSSSTLLAISAPAWLCHGPVPMRSRACTAAVPSSLIVLR